MALRLTDSAFKSGIKLLENNLYCLSISSSSIQIRERHAINRPRLRHPVWLTKKERLTRDDFVTHENQEFVKEVVDDRYKNIRESEVSSIEWKPQLKRTGVIARKIGVYPMWTREGKKITTTLLQVLDNHVIKYYPPEEYDPPRKRNEKIYNKRGCLLLGAESGDPSNFTREYCGLFTESGVIPKKILGRFFVSPDCALPLGSLVTARHFQAGNVVDVRGKTIDHGFQGVMKRHGFSGMPASHGVTKTHRRGGCIGGGGEKGRVWPGTKMPGHMGNTYRVAKGLTIYRINTKYNVLWVSGQAIPGETNSVVYIYDTVLPLKKPTKPVPVPTFVGPVTDDVEDYYHPEIHCFDAPSIEYEEIIDDSIVFQSSKKPKKFVVQAIRKEKSNDL